MKMDLSFLDELPADLGEKVFRYLDKYQPTNTGNDVYILKADIDPNTRVDVLIDHDKAYLLSVTRFDKN